MPLNFSSVIPQDKERVISTFDFIDIAKERAIVTFYAGHYMDAGINKFSLSNVIFTSEKTSIRNSLTASNFQQLHDNSHETRLDVPIIIGGDIHMNVPLAVDSDDANNANALISASLFISGASLRFLGMVSSGVLASTGTSEDEIKTSMKMNIPLTRIKAGEYLRWRISTFGRKDTAGNCFVWYGHDPAGTATHGTLNEFSFGSVRAYNNSRASILIPIKLDI